MPSIIGATRLIKYLKHQKRKRTVDPRKKHKEYQERDRELPFCGYASYPEYLASEQWQAIRANRLRKHPRCLLCEKAAEQVHHMSYAPRVLLGLEKRPLISLCRGCHGLIEFDAAGGKLSLADANRKLRGLAYEAGKHQWLNMIKQSLKSLTRVGRQDQRRQNCNQAERAAKVKQENREHQQMKKQHKKPKAGGGKKGGNHDRQPERRVVDRRRA
jgi:hypothetical protein